LRLSARSDTKFLFTDEFRFLEMLSIKKEWILKLAIGFLALVFSIYLAQWIVEKFFFDTFIYHKSVKYGYLLANKNAELKDFGKRAVDIIAIIAAKKDTERLKIQENLFTIAIIGDSVVWGQGIRNEDRFPAILEKRIKKIRPARVLSLAFCGDGLFDNYVKYQILMTHAVHVDFFVFGLVDNDLMLNNDNRYEAGISAEHSFGCPGPFVYIPRFDPTIPGGPEYERALALSYENSYGNLCLLNKIASLFPKNNAVYMSFKVRGRSYLNTYMEAFRDHGLRVITPTDFPQVYNRYRYHDPADFMVSKKDPHPSALANRMFAEMLFEELTSRGLLSAK
jgi:hypothetical protein